MNKWIALLSKKVRAPCRERSLLPEPPLRRSCPGDLGWSRCRARPVGRAPCRRPGSRKKLRALWLTWRLQTLAERATGQAGAELRRRWMEGTPNEAGSWTYLEPDLLAAPL